MGYTTSQFISFIRRTITDALNRQNTAAIVRSVMERFGVDYFNKESDYLEINQVNGLQDALDNAGGGAGLTPQQLAMLENALPAPADDPQNPDVRYLSGGYRFVIKPNSFFSLGQNVAIEGSPGSQGRNYLDGNWSLRATNQSTADYTAFVNANYDAIIRKDYLDTRMKDFVFSLPFSSGLGDAGPDYFEAAVLFTHIAFSPNITAFGVSTDGGNNYTQFAPTGQVWNGSFGIQAGITVFYRVTFASNTDSGTVVVSAKQS